MADLIKFDISGLLKFTRLLEKGLPSVKVGITGNKATVVRKEPGSKKGITNAEIGFIQEFGRMTGKNKIPPRSFIVMPLRTRLNPYLKRKLKMTQKAFDKAVKSGKAEELAAKVGLIAETVIQDAFATSGWGKWEANRPSTVKRKGSDKPLIDTGELRRSISSEVIK